MDGVGDEVAVGQHDALRLPGRAAGVEEPGDVVLVDAGPEVGHRLGGVDQGIESGPIGSTAPTWSASSPGSRSVRRSVLALSSRA